ncbi:unnamed protein product [Blepharisma stoltei]|uniref:Uncharacterized protein n=1 Tax=Blepharisma stoltei TaxID=1481888 RepID=A0AAU9J477_9CILI|nr:unnamed protein product [Blepharisma stoltei]
MPVLNAHPLAQNVRALQYAQSVQTVLLLLIQLVSVAMGTLRTIPLVNNAHHHALNVLGLLQHALDALMA